MKEILITSSVLILALLILRVLFAKKVRRIWIYGAWLLVALRLLIPVQIGQVSFSVLTMAKPLTEAAQELSDYRVLGQNQREAELQVTKDYIETDQSAFTSRVQDYIRQEQEAGTSDEEIAEALVKTQWSELYAPEKQAQVTANVEARTTFVSLGEVAKTVWLVGVAVMVIWLTTVNLLLGRSLRKGAKPMDCHSPIPVYVSAAAASPCLVGLFRPAVYLTPECAEDEKVLSHVLAHELTHYAHKDHIWTLVRCLCLCIYWFNPLVWVAAWVSRRDCELACDEGAVDRLGENERMEYGRSLLQVVSQASGAGRLIFAATTMAETKSQLKERMMFIVKKSKISVTAAICLVLVCALVTGCVATGPAKASGQAALELTRDVRKAIEDAYYNATGDGIDWENSDKNRYYGACGDYYIFFQATEETVKPIIQLGDYKFASQVAFELYAIHDGQLLKLQDIYDAGEITPEQVAEIYSVHRTYYYDNTYDHLITIAERYVAPTPKPSEPTEATMPPANTPIALSISEEDRLLVLEALKNYDENHYQEFFDGNYRYYGTYNGNIVLFFTGFLSTDWIYLIDVVKDGQVYQFVQYYPDSDLTEAQVDMIYAVYYSYTGIEIPPVSLELSEEDIALAEDTIYQSKGYQRDLSDSERCRYYGTYNGYTILFYQTTGEPDEGECGAWGEPSSFQVGNHWFKHDEAFEIWVIKDGQAEYLQNVYDQGGLTQEQLMQIYITHRSYYSYYEFT